MTDAMAKQRRMSVIGALRNECEATSTPNVPPPWPGTINTDSQADGKGPPVAG